VKAPNIAQRTEQIASFYIAHVDELVRLVRHRANGRA
jgi:hypothetical protein